MERFASRKGARRIAVENFLFSLPEDLTRGEQLANLRGDTLAYGWTRPTVSAIEAGIALAYGIDP